MEGLTKRSGIKTSLEIQPPHLPRFTPELENAVYRIVQETLTNVFRHSGAREARVELAPTNGHLTISVRDDGKGIPKRLTEFKPGSIGVGIGGMRQRVSELGGKLKLENTNPGTLVQVVIPNTSAEMGEQVASEISTEGSGNRPCGVNKSVQN